MFQPLTGKAHTKMYLRDRGYRTEYKRWKNETKAELIETYSGATALSFESGGIIHTVTPSNYEAGSIQLTFFINGAPHSHETHKSLADIVEMHFVTIAAGNITEVIA